MLNKNIDVNDLKIYNPRLLLRFDFGEIVDKLSMALGHSKFLSTQEWYHYSQLLLDSSYLQPFQKTSNGQRSQSKRVKTNTRNGYIEREIHGAMHASRVAWHTLMLHRLCLQQYSAQVQPKVQVLMQFTHLSEEALFCLIRYVGLGHDMSREGEGADFWESQSANRIDVFLTEHGLDAQLASIFSRLAYFKDKPQELRIYLNSFDIDEHVVDALQYARLLISLADCIDIIRCHGSFNFEFIEQKLAQVFPYSKENDALVFFEYATHTLEFLKQQKDLYFPTQLIGPHQEIFSLGDGENDYSIQEKVKLEHADNVPAIMLHSLNQDLYFQQLLQLEAPSFVKPYDKELPFNPYIHGTNSTALALMTQTEFQLMSPIEMLEQYGRAPLCGELTGGGFNTAMADGKPCFAKLNGEDDSNEYSLKKVIQNYAKPNQNISAEDCVQSIRDFCSYSSRTFFSGINIINIYLARAQLLGIHLQDIPEVQSLELEFQKTIDIFYLYLLFSTHIVAKKELSQLSFKEQIALRNDLEDHFSLKKVLQKFKQSDMSIKDIYHHPTAENCNKIIAFLKLPKTCRFQELFEFVAEPFNEQHEYRQLKNQLHYIVVNSSACNFEHLLHATCIGEYKSVHFQGMAPQLLDYLALLEKRFLVTKRLLQVHQEPFILSDKDLDLLENPLPLILCYEDSRNIRIFSMIHQEYRIQKPLKLGKDIRTIATDTEANMERLQAFSDRHHLNLNIISFADLKRAHVSLSSDHPITSNDLFLPNQAALRSAIKALDDFCKQQHLRLNQTVVLKSLTRFQDDSKKIILSNSLSAKEKKAQLIACAHHAFEHRHYTPRLLADALILISSITVIGFAIVSAAQILSNKSIFSKSCAAQNQQLCSSLALIGLSIGLMRILTGYPFFFSAEKTKREADFIKVADTIELGLNA